MSQSPSMVLGIGLGVNPVQRPSSPIFAKLGTPHFSLRLYRHPVALQSISSQSRDTGNPYGRLDRGMSPWGSSLSSSFIVVPEFQMLDSSPIILLLLDPAIFDELSVVAATPGA